jgi:GWxTD domain-containing protein
MCSLPVGYFASAVQLAPAQTQEVVAAQPAAKEPTAPVPAQTAQARPVRIPAQAPPASLATSQGPHDDTVWVISDADRVAFKRLRTEDERRRFIAQARIPDNASRRTLESPYHKWLNEDVMYVISEDERKAFMRLRTDDERQQFITQFWLRRDPTPGTETNEMKEENYRRIAFANEHFSAGIPGWQTDRGAVYIKYGPPDAIDMHGVTRATYAYEIWRYADPGGFGPSEFEFVDPSMTGRFHLTKDPTEKQRQ